MDKHTFRAVGNTPIWKSRTPTFSGYETIKPTTLNDWKKAYILDAKTQTLIDGAEGRTGDRGHYFMTSVMLELMDENAHARYLHE